MREPLRIAEEIGKARTPPPWLYTDPAVFACLRERLFARTWHVVADADAVEAEGAVHPATLLEGLLDEPLVLVRDAAGELRCLSNVCTHRGNLVVAAPGREAALRCRYHGRRFGLDGRCLAMPEFERVEGFPSPADDLAPVPHARWGRLVFAALAPVFPLADALGELAARTAGLPVDAARLDRARSRTYQVAANWALYCDNYLEGFHVPYVHRGLAGALDYGAYRTELFPWASLQVGAASGDEDVLDLPASSPDAGARVAGYYFFLFPATMLNVYPWGVSVNLVQPLAVDRTRVVFLSYVWDAGRLGRGASADLEGVEREDEEVVEAVQRGMRSRVYRGGRYSPAREAGVHHFHRLLARFLDAGPPA